MDHWGVRHRALYIGQGEEHGRRLPSDVPNEEESSDEEEEEEEEEEKVVKTEPVFTFYARKCLFARR
ncbi:hypothetical protein RIF29_41326 [Crotalaria pallida]|uniref:Uncharacterized protein n=1 Tax=Crotalaria pallida TaxID=3830 RepID=A0AAN9E7U0_CROPI